MLFLSSSYDYYDYYYSFFLPHVGCDERPFLEAEDEEGWYSGQDIRNAHPNSTATGLLHKNRMDRILSGYVVMRLIDITTTMMVIRI